jgi:hypothetical protein
MEKNISEKVEDLMKEMNPDNAQVKDFIRANEEYQKLIQEGLTMKRGFNIMTTGEIYNPALNCSHSQPSQRIH